MGERPILKYYWVKVLPDGKTCIPQFKPSTGEEIQWGESETQMSKLLLVPFDEELADMVYNATQGQTLPEASNRAVHEFELNPSDVVDLERRGYVTFWTDYECQVCGTAFKFNGEGKFECPSCGITDEWECLRCGAKEGNYYCQDCGFAWKRETPWKEDEHLVCPKCGRENTLPDGIVKAKPLEFPKGEMRCPDCENERHEGLVKVTWLKLRSHQDHVIHYYIRINDQIEMEIADDKVRTTIL